MHLGAPAFRAARAGRIRSPAVGCRAARTPNCAPNAPRHPPRERRAAADQRVGPTGRVAPPPVRIDRCAAGATARVGRCGRRTAARPAAVSKGPARRATGRAGERPRSRCAPARMARRPGTAPPRARAGALPRRAVASRVRWAARGHGPRAAAGPRGLLTRRAAAASASPAPAASQASGAARRPCRRAGCAGCASCPGRHCPPAARRHHSNAGAGWPRSRGTSSCATDRCRSLRGRCADHARSSASPSSIARCRSVGATRTDAVAPALASIGVRPARAGMAPERIAQLDRALPGGQRRAHGWRCAPDRCRSLRGCTAINRGRTHRPVRSRAAGRLAGRARWRRARRRCASIRARRRWCRRST